MAEKRLYQVSAEQAMRGMKFRDAPAAASVHTMPVGEEVHRGRILRTLPAEGKAQGRLRAHVGFAGFFNFEMAAVTQPDLVVLLDINPAQQPFFKEVLGILQREPTAEGFQKAFLSRIVHGQDPSFKVKGGTVDMYHARYLPEYFAQAGWMKPEAYALLHAMAREGRIVTLRVDAMDRNHMHAIRYWMDKEGIAAESIYGSNIADFASPRIDTDRMERMPKHAQGDLHALLAAGAMQERRGDFYHRGLAGADPQAMRLLANDDASRLYGSSTMKQPLIVIEGKEPVEASRLR